MVSAEITYANNLDRIETIRSDGRIDGADPSIAALTGRVEVRFADQVLVNQAIAGDPCELEFGYALPSGESFTFTVHAVYLPRPRIEIAGPQGVQATFDWQAARDAGRGAHVHRHPRQRRRGILRVRSGLEAENPFDVGLRVPANPDVIPDPIDVDAAGAAERRSLARHVGVRRPTTPDQPLRETGIETPGNGVLLDAGAHRERPNLELRVRPVPRRVPCSDHADPEIVERGKVGIEREHLRPRSELDRHPAGTVVDPLGVEDAAAVDPQPGGYPIEQRLVRRPRADQLRRREGQPPLIATDGNEAEAAFLNDQRAAWLSARGQPRMAGAEGRMPCEREARSFGVKMRTR